MNSRSDIVTVFGALMLLMAEMIFHLTFEHGLKNGAKNLLQDVLYVFRALDVVVVEDLLSNLLAWGSWWSFTLLPFCYRPYLCLPQYGA